MIKRRLQLIFLISALLLLSCPTGGAESAGNAQGKQLFVGHCAKCHGRNGEGFLKLYPPLQHSRFLSQDISRLPCVIRYGIKGEIIVEGTVFNQTMPGNRRLSNEDIRLIIHYMQDAWGKRNTELPVEKYLSTCDTYQ